MEPTRYGRRGFSLTVVGVGVAVFAFAARTLWDQVGSFNALAVFAALLVLAAIDLLVAFRSLRRPMIHVVAPPEAYVDEDMPLRILAHGLPRPTLLSIVSMRGSPTVRITCGKHGVDEGVLSVRPPVRSRIVRVIVEVSATGPLGFASCHRRLAVPFSETVHAAPRAAPIERLPDPGHRADSPQNGAVGVRRRSGGQPRGVRPYVPGDDRRLVHWPATARNGALAVRELDEPESDQELVVVLELVEPGPAAEEAVARCRAIVEARWQAGTPVRLRTIEPGPAPVPGFDPDVLSPRRRAIRLEQVHATGGAEEEGEVTGTTELHRRLSRAAFGRLDPGSPHGGGPGPGPAPDVASSGSMFGSSFGSSSSAPRTWWVSSEGGDGWR